MTTASDANRSRVRRGYVDTPGGQVHYRRSGLPGRPVIGFFHQTASSGRMFELVMRELGLRYDCYAFDTPGFGQSWQPTEVPSVRWLAERARRAGFATAEVQISEGETPLHHLETVYRRLVERLATAEEPHGALRLVIDAWFFGLEQDALADGSVDPDDRAALMSAADQLAERRLASIAGRAPAFAAALRGYRRALAVDDTEVAEGLLAWLGGQPNVAASVKRSAGIAGHLDHDAALAFLAGLLVVLRDAGYGGLVLVLDEIETLQRVRSDIRERALNALRQLMDEVDAGRFPGLYLVITGTPAFFDGPQGAQRLAPLAQRLHTDFTAEARFDNPRAVQLRLTGLNVEGLCEVGGRVRDLFADGCASGQRLSSIADDRLVRSLANAVTGGLGGKVGIAPRLFLKKLVDLLDRIDAFADFDPRRDYTLKLGAGELTDIERNAAAEVAGSARADDVELDW